MWFCFFLQDVVYLLWAYYFARCNYIISFWFIYVFFFPHHDQIQSRGHLHLYGILDLKSSCQINRIYSVFWFRLCAWCCPERSLGLQDLMRVKRLTYSQVCDLFWHWFSSLLGQLSGIDRIECFFKDFPRTSDLPLQFQQLLSQMFSQMKHRTLMIKPSSQRRWFSREEQSLSKT